MAAEPRYTDEVQIVLKSVKKASGDKIFDRHLLLSKNKSKVEIGRSTKRDARLTARPDNGWFESHVMSRNHARLLFAPKTNTVLIMDIGSLHGTYVNNNRIGKFQIQKLTTGDTLRFGAPIQKGLDVFPPCEVKVELKHGSSNHNERPLVFKVPDSTDEEDNASDVDLIVDSTMANMQRTGMTFMRPDQTTTISAIDLTGDEASTTKDTDIPAIKNILDETSSDDKPVCEQDPMPSVPKVLDRLDHESEPDMDAYGSNSSLIIDTDEESDSSSDVEQGMSASEKPCVFQDWPSEPEIGQSVLTYSQPSSCANGRSDLSDPGDRREEEISAMEDVDSSPVFSDPKLGPQAQKVDAEKRGPWPRVANSDTISMSTIYEPFSKITNHPEASAGDCAMVLGTRADFFAARKHNRRVHVGHKDDPERTAEPGSNNDAEDGGSPLAFSTHYSVSNVLGTSKSSTCTSTAALLASREQLLQTPIVDETCRQKNVLEDFLDDSSAFSYEMSKRSAVQMHDNRIVSDLEETRLADDEMQTPQSLARDSNHYPRKRKSDEISILLPTEVEAGSSQTQFASSQPPVSHVEASAPVKSDDARVIFTDPRAYAERPFKRLRRAAEILGYASLGGIAVMSALIATAPAL